MSEKPLTIVPRDHFERDPIFQDCWEVLQKERQSLARRSFYGQNGHPDVKIPWKWDTLGIMKEFFHGPSNIEKSCEVDTSKWFYKVLLDVQHFTPDNLAITLTNRTIIIKGKHEEKGDLLGVVSRQFTRKYTFPSDVIMDRIQCHLSSDGVLHITAPRNFDHDVRNDEFVIPKDAIKHSFPQAKALNEPSCTITDVTNHESEQCSIHSIPDFDMVPFWARDATANSRFGIKSDLDKFKVVIDVGQFAPEEVNVYSTRHYITVEGKHEEKQDPHGFITRQFTRKYWMPAGVKTGDLVCRLATDGVLEIMAPMPKHNHEEIDNTVRLPIIMIEEARVQKWVDPNLYN